MESSQWGSNREILVLYSSTFEHQLGVWGRICKMFLKIHLWKTSTDFSRLSANKNSSLLMLYKKILSKIALFMRSFVSVLTCLIERLTSRLNMRNLLVVYVCLYLLQFPKNYQLIYTFSILGIHFF